MYLEVYAPCVLEAFSRLSYTAKPLASQLPELPVVLVRSGRSDRTGLLTPPTAGHRETWEGMYPAVSVSVALIF